MRTNFILISVLLMFYANNLFSRELHLKIEIPGILTGEEAFQPCQPEEMAQKGNDRLNGPKKDYYPNGRIKREYTLKDGKIVT